VPAEAVIFNIIQHSDLATATARASARYGRNVERPFLTLCHKAKQRRVVCKNTRIYQEYYGRPAGWRNRGSSEAQGLGFA